MKKQKHLQTNFIKFILEKYNKEIQDLPNEETNISNKELIDEFDEIMNGNEVSSREIKSKEVKNEQEDDDDENVDELLKEYLMLEKKYKSKRNDSLFKRK